jgi:hypothetical protein
MTLSTSTVILAPGNSRTYSLAPGEAVTVATEPNCYVTVTETPDVIATADQGGQTNARESILQYKGEWTYGPYALGGTVAVAVSLSKSTSSVSVTLGSTAAAAVGAAGVDYVPGRKVRSMLGAEAFNLVAISGLPAEASFSGAGSYNSAGILAVQSTGTITHNPTGWYDGSACLEFTPNTDSNAEFRIYNAVGLDIYDPDGIAFEFDLPEMDTSKVNFSIIFDFSDSATNLFPVNTKSVPVWRCDQTVAQTKEKAGRKYIRQRWDHDATDANCGAWPGYGLSTGGTGADETKSQTWIRFRVSKFSGKTIKFKSVRLGGRATPCFVFGSDNATPRDLFNRAFAYMAAKGIPGYIAQYTSALSSIPSALAGCRSAYAAGFEMTGDDIVDRSLGSSVTDEATMRAAVEGTLRDMLGYGFRRGSRAWVANNNSSSYLMIRELARAGYVCNRNGETDGRYVFTEGGVPDAFRLPATSMDNKNFTEIQPVLDRAITMGCSLWYYWHGMLSSARIDSDRVANVTGTVGAPIARSGTESLQQYRARALALGTAVGTASVTYFDARIGSSGLGMWWEEFKQVIDYVAPKSRDGTCVVLSPEDWCRNVGLL